MENEVRTTKRYTVTETEAEFRVDLLRTPLKFLGKLGTTFWGFRARDPVPGGLELRQHRIRLRVPLRELVTLECSISDTLGLPLNWGAGTDAVLGKKDA